jgi:hypothetical protein
MEVTSSTESLLDLQWTTWSYIPKDRILESKLDLQDPRVKHVAFLQISNYFFIYSIIIHAENKIKIYISVDDYECCCC